MKINDAGINLIKQFESCKLKAYPDPANSNGRPVTIGWGSTIKMDGTKFKLGDKITQQEADDLLRWEIQLKSNAVANSLNPYQINDNQFGAVVSFTYNVGIGNFIKSTLLKKIKLDPKDPSIADEFMKWTKANGNVYEGLVKRRKAESELYFTV